MKENTDSSSSSSTNHLRILDVVAADGAPELFHKGLELSEAMQHRLVRQETDILDVVVRLVLARSTHTKETLNTITSKQTHNKHAHT